ncbi:aspartate aminotransferase family protein [Henriciella mobilis]|uniref:aspartate aminotransferase family protein n=1 Tax=Henriciella mobilis TaxID=2305467 RepID=UPI000E667E43|nr:aspartate aminotransferase family protein [Henriciella mobilis]RIJ14473.1 aspartate aminotransferase family protein [Henriciella mobilis]RIJ19700.1 aspartate aminotransferase family protein [Henriciella mobilis]
MSDPRAHIMPVYAPPSEVFVRGEGVRLYTEEGAEYLDFIAGIAVNALGHSHPKLVEALTEQGKKLWHLSNMFRVPAGEQLADKICARTFADRVFFTNSGTEAVECALKAARKYHWSKGDEERIEFVTFTGAFHGRSLGAINAGGNPKYLEGFGPPIEGFTQIEWGDHDALDAAVTDKTAAVFVEPVQGEGGVRAMPEECLTGLRKLCDERGALLIYDEIQCGMGRTGQLFAFEWAENAQPDIMCLAKGIGGGFPLGACLMTEEVGLPMQPGSHGSTYGGNPLAMAVGNAVWDIISDEAFLAEVRRVSGTVAQGLKSLADSHPDKVDSVTGKGLLTGLKLKAAPKPVQNACREKNLLVGVAGANVLRLAPPLIISDEDVREAVGVIDQALSDWEMEG